MHRLALPRLVKGIVHSLISVFHLLALQIYLREMLKEGYCQESLGKSRFYGPDDFIVVCKEAAAISLRNYSELLKPLLCDLGIVLFLEDSRIGACENYSIRYFSLPKEYVTYGPEGIIAYLVLIAISKQHEFSVGPWNTGIPTISRREVNSRVADWLVDHVFDPALVETFRRSGGLLQADLKRRPRRP